MPFPDEPAQVTIVDYQPGWPREFDRIAGRSGGAGPGGDRLAVSVPDLADYGQIKSPATEVLIRAAEMWAAQTGWAVS